VQVAPGFDQAIRDLRPAGGVRLRTVYQSQLMSSALGGVGAR
jgi:hypothetical protein